MALHPGSLSAAYAALQVHGWPASTMRRACERAAYSGSFTQGRVTVTFDREAGYRVTARPLPELPAGDETVPLVTVRSFAPHPSTSYLASIAAEYGADVVISPDGSRWSRLAGPQADVYMARAVKRGWHMEGTGTIVSVITHLNGQATFSGPQGHCTFALDCLVKATPCLDRDALYRAVDGWSDLELYDAYESAYGEASRLLLDEINARIAVQADQPPSAAETPGTIASACAFGWS